MKEQNINKQITKYLKGQLSEPEAMDLWKKLFLNQSLLDQLIIESYLYSLRKGKKS